MSGKTEHDKLSARLEDEVKAVHEFIGAWFRGDVASDLVAFNREFAAHLADDLINIQPGGGLLTRQNLLSMIHDGYGGNGNFRIEIRDFRLRRVWPDVGLVLATYVELQKGARNTTPPDNERITTVLFDVSDELDHPLWLHLHESAVRPARAG